MKLKERKVREVICKELQRVRDNAAFYVQTRDEILLNIEDIIAELQQEEVINNEKEDVKEGQKNG